MVRRHAAFPALAVVSLLVLGTHCSEHDIRFRETANPSNGGNLASGGDGTGGANASGGSGGSFLGFGGIVGTGGKNLGRGGTPAFESGGRSAGGSMFGLSGNGGRFGNGGGSGSDGDPLCTRRCFDRQCTRCDPSAAFSAGGNGPGAGGSTSGAVAGNASFASGGASGGNIGVYECRSGLRCDPDCGYCVECVKSSDCANGRFKCDFLTARCMLECADPADCPWPTPVCDLPRHVCVQCKTRDDCRNGLRCDENECVP